jgi:GAF domain-containing protein
VAINNARFIEETEKAQDEATQLYEITEQLASTTDMDGVLVLIAAKAAELLGSHSSGFLRFDEAKGALVRASAFNLIPVSTEITVLPGEGVTGLAFQERRPVWFDDYTIEQRSILSDPNTQDALEAGGVRAMLAVPVIVRNEPYGVLAVYFQEPHRFEDADVRLLEALADSAAVAIGNARFIEETQHAREAAEEANRTKS